MVTAFFNRFRHDMPDWSGSSFDFLKNHDMLPFHRSLEGYKPTPLLTLPDESARLGIGSLYVKDESHRFGIKAFKALGASYAIFKLLKSFWERSYDTEFSGLSFRDGSEQMKKLGSFTFCAATDGNHGRAVAWTARMLKQKAVICMPNDSVPARVEAIRREGAEVVLLEGTYDDCVRWIAEEAKKRHWIEIADTAYPGYTQIPAWVMNGYSTIFRELEHSIAGAHLPEIDAVILQAGVGAFAAAGVSFFTLRYGVKRPRLIIVEPAEAACFLDSARYGDGKPVAARGAMKTIMAGLNCGLPSLVAWPIIRDAADLFLGIEDSYTEIAMRQLRAGGITAGESGAAGLAGLIALMHAPEVEEARKKLGLGSASRVLVVNTEGDTDPENYNRIVEEL